MIRDERDPTFWDAIANHPSVRPHVGGEGPLSLSEVIGRDDILPLATDHGGFIFACIFPARWELHTMVLPEGRGRATLTAFAEAKRRVFTSTDAVEIITKAADTNRPAQFMARRAGFRVTFRRADVEHYTLGLDDWIASDDALPDEGHAFHETLEAAKRAAGSELPVHEDDEAHDRAVGAASLMFKAGRHLKAVWTYNRWASFAGYQQIELASQEPPVMDVRDALVTVRGGRMEVVQCR